MHWNILQPVLVLTFLLAVTLMHIHENYHYVSKEFAINGTEWVELE